MCYVIEQLSGCDTGPDRHHQPHVDILLLAETHQTNGVEPSSDDLDTPGYTYIPLGVSDDGKGGTALLIRDEIAPRLSITAAHPGGAAHLHMLRLVDAVSSVTVLEIVYVYREHELGISTALFHHISAHIEKSLHPTLLIQPRRHLQASAPCGLGFRASCHGRAHEKW